MEISVAFFCIILVIILVLLAAGETIRIILHKKVQGLKKAYSGGEREFIEWVENTSWSLIKKESDGQKDNDLMDDVQKHSEFPRGIVRSYAKGFYGKQLLIMWVIPTVLLVILGIVVLISGISDNSSSQILTAFIFLLTALLATRVVLIFRSMKEEAEEAVEIYDKMIQNIVDM